MQLTVLLLGASGRLGQTIAQKLSEQNIQFLPVTRSDVASCQAFRNFLHTVGLDANKYLLLLDVSLANVTASVAQYLSEMMQSRSDASDTLDIECMAPIHGFIVGTTGHSLDCQNTLRALSTHIPICVAPNFSKGIFLLGQLLSAQIANTKTFADLAQEKGFHISLRDVHHQHKKDAPSGTALWLNQWLGVPTQSIESVRTGEVIGEHAITFSAQNETIELSHKVISRDVFAHGACDLSIHFFEKKLSSGIYSVADIWI